MQNETTFGSLKEAFEYIDRNIEDNVVFTIELVRHEEKEDEVVEKCMN